MKSNRSESSSSDDEFWQSLDKKFEKADLIQVNAPIEPSSILNLSQNEKDRLLKTISNIRDSKEVEFKQFQIKLESISKKEMQTRISQIKEESFQEYQKLNCLYKESQSDLCTQNKKIKELCLILSAQEALITDMRIEIAQHSKLAKLITPDIAVPDSSHLSHELELYKELLSQEKAENEALLSKVKSLEEENQALKSLIIPPEELEKLKQEKASLKKEFDRFKLEVGKEVELRELLNDRHLQSISALQEEIKSIRLSTPMLDLRHFNQEKENTQKISLDNSQGRSFPRSLQSRNKPSYTYKEYKAALPDSTRNLTPLLSMHRPPRPEFASNKSVNSSSDRPKFFKSSALIVNKESR